MKKLSFLFALLCASMMSWATQYCGEALASTVGATTGQTVEFTASKTGELETTFSITSATSTIVGLYEAVLQNNGGGVLAGDWNNNSGWTLEGNTLSKVVAWTTYPTGNLQLHLIVRRDNSGGDSDIMGRTFTDIEVSAACGGGGGGGAFDPSTIDWSSVAFISGSSQFKIYFTDANRPANYTTINVQTAPWADNNTGIYVTFPDGVSACSLIDKTGCWIEGAQVLMYLTAFVNEVTEVTINHASGTKTLYVYNANASGTDPEPTEIYDVNFALQSQGGVASAKSGNDAGLANNGNTGDRWWSETAEMTDAEKNDQWWQVDLGQRRIFNTIQIVWEGAWGKSFDIQISDDGDAWTTVKEIRNQNIPGPFPYEQTIDLDANKTARYVRFQGIERGTGYAYSFWEFRVLLPGVSVLTSIDLTAPAQIAEVGGVGVALTAQPKDQNGQNMEAEISWEITPAAAGHMSGSTYIPDQIGNASIRAYNGDVYSTAVSIIGVPSANLALSTNISTDNKIIAQSDFTPNGTDAFHAVDGNMGSVWQGSPTNGNVDDSREYDCWFVVDLGAFYNIDLVALHFEGACSELYHIDFSENNSDWNLGYNLVGAEGINARNDYWTDLNNNTKVRYVRFWSTKAATGWGMKLFEFEVYGTEWSSGDDEKPVMVSASLVSSTINSAVIAVSATDNEEVARYHVVDNVNGIDANFTPSAGNITVTGLTHNTAYNFTITAKDASNNESENSKEVAVTTPFDGSVNLALNQPSEGGYYDNNPAESADKANDGDNNTSWVTYGAHAIELDWWVVDLGNVYNLTNITALWANDAYATAYMLQARVEAPTAADKADDAAWVTLANVSGVTAGEEKSTNVSGVGRYVRFRATANAGGFFRLREFRVYASGVATIDTEKPVMTSASLVSNTDVQAVIAVAATDNQGIANYHVVDAGNSIDGHFAPAEGQITVTGLTGGTNYTLVITAVDFFGNESENSKSVAVTTTAHYTEPQAACPAPTWDATWVKAMYSPTYSADCGFDAWGSGTTATDDAYGKKCAVGSGYFGMVNFTLNCLLMEKVHFDIWVENDLSIRFVPIWGGGEQGITKSLEGQQWNSIDIDMSDYTNITNWGNITQFKLDQMPSNFNLWIANAYFYRESAYVDTEAPTNVSASVAAEGFYSVKITAQAEDNSGAVNFKVMNGAAVVATGAAETGVATTIKVNNLTPGTNYNFNVIAYDEAGNEAAPVVVAPSTKSIPSSAPAPDFSNKNVVAVFTDATACVVSGIQSGGWGETTQVEWLDIAPSDKVFYAQNFNYAGWHSWAGGNINATGMQYLHVDIYSIGMTAVAVTPISEGHEGSATINLTPNAWTSYDVPLSAYATNNIDWENIFQFKFMGAVGGDELIIDNVYFYAEVPAKDVVRDGLSAGKWGTICPKQNVENVEGAEFYQISYLEEQNGLPYNMVWDQISGTTLTAGQPYFFIADGTQILGNKTGAELTVAGDGVNGFYGYISSTNAAMELTNWHAEYDAAETYNTFIIYNNSVFRINQSGTMLNSERCYININSTEPRRGVVAPAPGLKRLNMSISGTNETTDIDALKVSDKPVKMIIDGQLYILRGEKLYDSTGRMVK